MEPIAMNDRDNIMIKKAHVTSLLLYKLNIYVQPKGSNAIIRSEKLDDSLYKKENL